MFCSKYGFRTLMVGRFWMSFLNHIIRMVWSLGEAGWHQSFKDQRLPGYSLAVGQNFGLPTTAWNWCCQDSHQTGSTTEGCKSLVATSTSQWVATASTTWPTWILASWQQVDQYTSLAKGFPIFLGAVSRNTWRSPCFPTRLEFGRVLTYLHSWRWRSWIGPETLDVHKLATCHLIQGDGLRQWQFATCNQVPYCNFECQPSSYLCWTFVGVPRTSVHHIVEWCWIWVSNNLLQTNS